MRTFTKAVSLLVLSAVVVAPPDHCLAQVPTKTVAPTNATTAAVGSGITGKWHPDSTLGPQVTTIDLKADGGALRGSVKRGPVTAEIYDGKIDGSTITFKFKSPDGSRTITLVGTMHGDEIAFSRAVVVAEGGNAAGSGIFGALGSPTFTATRATEVLGPDHAAHVQWLQQHAAPIRSVDPADEDFSDLAPLGAAIGKARIVMLGEQSHGDGTTFLAKTRIIKYLHERLGFDVLAFESGLYDVQRAWSFLQGGEDARTAFSRGVFVSPWAGSAQVQPLVEYLGRQVKTAHPLEVTGFDCQFTGTASRDFFRADLRAFLASHGIDTTTIGDWPRISEMLDGLTTGGWALQKPTEEQFAKYMASWDVLRARVDRIAVKDTGVVHWKQLLKSTAAVANELFVGLSTDTSKQAERAWASVNLRDAQMGDNLLWLARTKFPDRKIIVWAATFHIMRNAALINTDVTTPSLYKNVHTMGHVVSGALRDSVYAIGFIASQGSAGIWGSQSTPIPTPSSESLEGLFASTTRDNAYIDFRELVGSGLWLQQSIISGPLGYSAFSADWTRVLDGMFYTRRMTPSTPVIPPPPPPPTFTDAERAAAACAGHARLGCGLGLEQFALIPAGTFQMGVDNGAAKDGPSHSVTISRAFYLQKTEVTQAQWREVMDTNPSFAASCGDTCPVDQVSWEDIQTFLQKLNARTPGVIYRLPTEAEWEYAARAGTTGGTYGPLDSIAWYRANSGGRVHPVAGKQANAWGLFDMMGNVWERVNDWYGGAYSSEAATDPAGPAKGDSRVDRGSSYYGSGSMAPRGWGAPSNLRYYGYGFRLVRTP